MVIPEPRCKNGSIHHYDSGLEKKANFYLFGAQYNIDLRVKAWTTKLMRLIPIIVINYHLDYIAIPIGKLETYMAYK